MGRPRAEKAAKAAPAKGGTHAGPGAHRPHRPGPVERPEGPRWRPGRGAPGRTRAAAGRPAQGPRAVGGDRRPRAARRHRRARPRAAGADRSRCRLRSSRAEARSEAPQGVLAKARAAARRPSSTSSCSAVPAARRRSSSPSTASPIRATSVRCSARPSATARRASCCPATGPSTSPRRWRRPPPARSSTCRWRSSAACPRPSSGRRRPACWVVGLDDAADRRIVRGRDSAAEPVVLVLGAEGAGLSALVRERCDVVAAIPLRGRLASLNVAAAAAHRDLRGGAPASLRLTRPGCHGSK